MTRLTEALKNKLMKAKTNEEVAEILKADGQQIDKNTIGELKNLLNSEGRELSLDELETVGGGLEHITRDWVKSGCYATVGPNSTCWSSDGCSYLEVCYDNEPVSLKCPVCGSYLYDTGESTGGRESQKKYRCKNCGFEEWVQ